MRCEELKKRVWGGDAVDGAMKGHVAECPACREEFGFLDALRASRLEAPAGLRDRVLEAMPAPRRAMRWQVPAVAAAIALALGAGVLVGREVEAKNVAPERARVVVREVVREAKADDKDFTVLAIALESIYRGQVDCEYEGVKCRKIHAKKTVMEMVPYCPVAQKLEVMAKERPEQVEIEQ
ncbi:MAG: hypothetical protein HYY18_04780 [Planctomycetes bacterium]|nr:hypothetical protein [Planctomycetota bacterium]